MFQGRKALTLAQQLGTLRRDWPQGQGRLTKDGLEWFVALQPTPLSRSYVIRLTYATLGSWPNVHVVSPSLRELAGPGDIPHLYCQRMMRLCLFAPWLREWQSDRPLSRTLVLWATTWLFYFEDWLATGEWQGGGFHAEPTAAGPRLSFS